MPSYRRSAHGLRNPHQPGTNRQQRTGPSPPPKLIHGLRARLPGVHDEEAMAGNRLIEWHAAQQESVVTGLRIDRNCHARMAEGRCLDRSDVAVADDKPPARRPVQRSQTRRRPTGGIQLHLPYVERRTGARRVVCPQRSRGPPRRRCRAQQRGPFPRRSRFACAHSLSRAGSLSQSCAISGMPPDSNPASETPRAARPRRRSSDARRARRLRCRPYPDERPDRRRSRSQRHNADASRPPRGTYRPAQPDWGAGVVNRPLPPPAPSRQLSAAQSRHAPGGLIRTAEYASVLSSTGVLPRNLPARDLRQITRAHQPPPSFTINLRSAPDAASTTPVRRVAGPCVPASLRGRVGRRRRNAHARHRSSPPAC